jgi:hypothetical protein
MCNKQGFVFSLDAFLAVVVLSISIAAMFFFLSQSQTDNSIPLLNKKQANDALAVLDRSGDLAGMNATTLNSTLAALLAPNLKFNLTCEYYNYSSGAFAIANTTSAGQAYSGKSPSTTGEREFLVAANGTARYFGRARLMVWN